LLNFSIFFLFFIFNGQQQSILAVSFTHACTHMHTHAHTRAHTHTHYFLILLSGNLQW